MFYNLLKDYIKKTVNENEVLKVLNQLKTTEKNIFVYYNGNQKDGIYLLEETEDGRFLKKYDEQKEEFNEIADDKLADYFAVKKVVIFDSTDANRSIGRGGGKKDDFAVYSLSEAIIGLKNLIDFNEESTLSYLENKKKRFSIDYVKEKVKTKKLIVNGDQNLFFQIAEQRLDNLKQNSDLNAFENNIIDTVKNKIFEKIANSKEIDFKKDRGLRVIFADGNISNNQNIRWFNELSFLTTDELRLENNRIFYPLKMETKLKEKPLISKIRRIYIDEYEVFATFFFMKYYSKLLKRNITEKIDSHFKDNYYKPFYYFENVDNAVANFDVITNNIKEFYPSFILINLTNYFKNKNSNHKLDFEEYTEIKDFKKLLYMTDLMIEKVYKKMKGAEKKYNTLNYIINETEKLKNSFFENEEEINFVVRNFLRTVYNYNYYILSQLLKSYSKEEMLDKKGFVNYKKLQDMLYVIGYLISLEIYLNNLNQTKGVNMAEIVKTKLAEIEKKYNEIIEKLDKGDKDVEASNEVMSYIAGNVIKYFFKNRKGKQNLGLLIPIFENTRTFKDVKEELNKVISSYGYDTELYYRINKLVALLNTVDDKVKVNKNFFIAGLLDEVNRNIFQKKSEKGEENE